MKVFRFIIILLCVISIIFGIWKIYEILLIYRRAESSYLFLEESVVSAQTNITPYNPSTSSETQDEIASSGMNRVKVNFSSLLKTNSRTVGWIYLEQTPINYPIVQADSNAFYLDHLWNGELNNAGSIFLDSVNNSSFLDTNSIIYGHNMKNGSMFAGLLKYKDQEFYNSHPIVYLYTPEQNYCILLFSGYVSSGWGDAWRTCFEDDQDFGQWLENQKGRSQFCSDVIPSICDRIITLSTCTNEFDDARFVLLGVLREI